MQLRPGADRAWGWAKAHPEWAAFLLILAVVLIANGLYLLGLFDPNPLAARSALAIRAHNLLGASQPTIDPNNGYTSQALGYRAMNDLLHLHLPWWNPYEGLGAPLAGGMQSASLFPFTLPVILSNGQIYEHMMLELLSGWSTYLLLRRLGLRRTACIAGGSLFALNGTFAWFAHAPVNPIAFLPLALLGIERAYSASLEHRVGGWGLLAGAAALSVLGGFPETAYIDALFVLAWALWRGVVIWRGAEHAHAELIAFGRKVALGGAGGLLLAAPLIVAFVDYLGVGDLGSNAGNVFGSAHLSVQVGLPGMILPYIYGPIFAFFPPSGVGLWWSNVGGYLSTGMIFFAVLGLARPGHRGLKALLVAAVLIALLHVFGLPLGSLVNLLPDMGNVAFYRYAWPVLELAVVILAALGLDAVMRERPREAVVLGAAGVCATLVVGAALLALPVIRELHRSAGRTSHYAYLTFAVAVAWGVAVVGAAAWATLQRHNRVRMLAVALVVLIDGVCLFAAPELSAPRSTGLDLKPVEYLRSHLGQQRFFTLAPVQPDYGSYFGLKELDVNDVPIPDAFARYVSIRLAPFANPLVFVGNQNAVSGPGVPTPEQELVDDVNGYRAAAVSYVLTDPGMRLPAGAGFTLVERTPTAWIYHLSGSERYFTPSTGCSTSAVSDESVTVTCTQPGRLLKRELFMSGWSATVNSSSTPVRRSGYFQSIALPQGRSVVDFNYTPPHEWLGWLGLLAGLVLLSPRLLYVGRRGLARRSAVQPDIPSATEG